MLLAERIKERIDFILIEEHVGGEDILCPMGCGIDGDDVLER